MSENNNNTRGGDRKPRVNLTKKDVQQVKNMKEDNKKAKDIAKDVMISIATVYKIIQKLEINNGDVDKVVESFLKSGRKPNLNLDVLNKVGEAIQNDCCFTQKGIAQHLLGQSIEISQPTVCRTLKKLGVTRKRVNRVAENTLSPQLIAERKQFALKLRTIPKEKLLFLDETGFNLHTSRNYGYSPINTPCVSTVPANRGRNVSVLAIINENNVLHNNSVVGSFNGELFFRFLEECKEKNIIRKDNYVILDNARIHKTQDVMNFFTSNGFNIVFLPPYSPQLNPIEQVFSILKNRYHDVRPRARSSSEIISIVNNVIQSMNDDVSLSFRNLYEHMKTNLDIAFNGGVLH